MNWDNNQNTNPFRLEATKLRTFPHCNLRMSFNLESLQLHGNRESSSESLTFNAEGGVCIIHDAKCNAVSRYLCFHSGQLVASQKT